MSVGPTRLQLIAIAALIVVVTPLAFSAEKRGCERRWPDRDHRFDIPRGCLVKSGDFFVPEDRLRFYDGGVTP